jgi:glycosyltransferase involved in cell wall biosynthesis
MLSTSGVVLGLGAVAAALAVTQLATLSLGGRRLPGLADAPAAPLAPGPGGRPLVSVVVAARDEAHTIADGLRSLRALGGPAGRDAVEVVVVDDRSADGTGDVARRAAAGDPRVRVVRVDALPDGWLGKTHALERGAAAARGEWLLFTDADVVFAPDALPRLLGLAAARGADFLAAGPSLELRTWPLALVVNHFVIAFLLYTRPWRVGDPRAREAVGVGACNLVRASAYRAAGGHVPVRLRPDDDVALARALKRAGARLAFAHGGRMLRVAWYDSLGAFARGLEKNAYAGVEYRLWLAAAGVAATVAAYVGPLAGVVLAGGAARWLFAAAALAQLAMYADVGARGRTRPWLAPLYAAAALGFAWVIARAVWLTVRRGGVEWRGTRYPLALLRTNRVP